MMEAYKLQVPSKTFLLGEYVALSGGPAILLTTPPYFELIALRSTEKNKSLNVHAQCPAGKLLASDKIFKQYQLSFIDPHQGAGGYGASSAQFLLLNTLRDVINKKMTNDDELLHTYQTLCKQDNGALPSGYDVLAQKHGQICFISRQEKKYFSFSWPFANLMFALVHTGKKLATHDHLNNLNDIQTSQLAEIVTDALHSMEEKDEDKFINCIKKYAQTMEKEMLVASHTQELLHILNANQAILAAKGCGSLGADVILIIFNKNHLDEIEMWLNERNFDVTSIGNTVGHGLQIDSNFSNEDMPDDADQYTLYK